MNITQFTMEEVRCFAECQQFEIRPLTFLVGENSTGKTTALACFQVLANYINDGEVDFNADPYSMGIFQDIVRNSRKKDKVFKLGFTFDRDREDVEYTVEFVKKKDGFEPTVKLIRIKFTDGEITCKSEDTMEGSMRLASFDKKQNQYHIDSGADFLDRTNFSYVLMRVFALGIDGKSEGLRALENYLNKKHDKRMGIRYFRDHISVFSTSPVRSRPKRTYDPTREFNDPEGSDVPMRLMRIEATKKNEWEALKQQLVEFGKSSGLFQNIEIQNLGGSIGAPFQLKIKVRGPNSNIIDVGYGVSQILPILVQILDRNISRRPTYRSGRKTFLLQQPEVHLHPKAQAQLSSLLAELASRRRQSFIIETHSDYMIDRARIEIRKGTISPKAVSLIYLEPKGHVVNVHNISFDKMGNMIGAPTHYREFFSKETDRLLGFEN